MTPSSANDVRMQPVFIALQANNDTLPIIDAIRDDNPHATVDEYPAMVKITAPGSLVVKRTSIESYLGREFDLREVHINLVSLSGEVEESLDTFTLQWRSA